MAFLTDNKKKQKNEKKQQNKTIKTLRSLKRKISGEFKWFKTGVTKNLLEIQIKIWMKNLIKQT